MADDMTRRRPSVRQVAASVLIALAVVCLTAGAGMAVEFVVKETHDPAGSVGETIIAVIMGLLVYGPMMVMTGWPITVPVILVVGLGFAYRAYLWPRHRRAREPSAASGAVRVVLLGYAFFVCLAWLVLLLNPR